MIARIADSLFTFSRLVTLQRELAKMVNWKRGISRLYIIFWALWLIVLLMRISPMLLVVNFTSMSDLWPTIEALAFFGLILPVCILLGLRWAIDGFGSKSLNP
jgi:hypothetical protein